MFLLFVDFFDVFQNKEVFFTYFPESGLLLDGKLKTDSKVFFYDQELCSECQNIDVGEIFSFDSSLSKLAHKYNILEYEATKEKIKNYRKIYNDISLRELVRFLIPKELIKTHYNNIFEIVKKVFLLKRPENYNFLLKERKLIEEISQNRLNIDRNIVEYKHGKSPEYIKYDMYRGSTGRLVTNNNSFEILNIPKEFRRVLRPNNDIFVSYDISAADFRTFLYLFTDVERSVLYEQEDLYKDIAGKTRQEQKQKCFETIYSCKENPFLLRHDVFKKSLNLIIKEDDESVTVLNPYKRTIRVPKKRTSIEHLIISYLIQSTTNDVCLEAAFKVQDILSGAQSKICFLIHDCIVIDFSYDDFSRFSLDIMKEINYTSLGRYFWKQSIGKNFGAME